MLMLPFFAIIYIMFAHWVADFIFQTNDMALNKSKSIYWLSRHVAVYTLIIFGFMWVLGIFVGLFIGPPLGSYVMLVTAATTFSATFAAINGVMHWIVDYFTSKISAYYWNNDKRHNFFVLVGLDQYVHSILLLGTLVVMRYVI